MGRWCEAFLQEATLERDLAPRTREAYARDLELLGTWCARRDLAVETASTDDLVAWLGHRRRSGDARTTRARRTAAVRAFFGWLKESGRIDRNPALLLPTVKPGRRLPKALAPDATEALLAAPGDEATPPALRDHAVLEVLYGAGLRASEVAGLRLRDLEAERGFLRVLGKGRKERKVPLGQPGLAALETWLRRGRPRVATPASEDALLLSDRGRPLSRDTVYRIVKRWVRAVGLDAKTSPHTLRHTFATHLVKGGADLRAVQEMLGHASINTTQLYTTLADEHLRQAHRKHHPRG